MNQLSRREKNRQEKRDRILSAAIRVFAKSGYSGASMDEIATQAGLTKPTLYQYFSGKDALFAAMMASPKDTMMLAIVEPTGENWVAQLLEFAWAYAQTVMHPDYLSLARLIIGEANRFPDIGKEYQSTGPDKVLAGLMAFMVAQHDEGRLRIEDAELAAEDFWGLILSAPRNRALHIPNANMTNEKLSRYINNGIRVFLRAYSTQPELHIAQLEKAISARQ